MHKNFGLSSLLDYLCPDAPPPLELFQVERGSVVVRGGVRYLG